MHKDTQLAEQGPVGARTSGGRAETPFDVVAIAASAGGIPAIRALLVQLPPAFPAALLVHQHLHPHYPSKLPEVLQRASRLPVAWARPHARLRPGTVTLAPPGQQVHVAPSGLLRVTSWEPRGGGTPSADGLFASVADSFTTRAIGVVLTGYLRDGAAGVRALHQQGGRVLVQDPHRAAAPGMPAAAIATGCVDFVLPLPVLGAALIALVMVPGAAQFFAVPAAPPAPPYREALRRWRV